MRLGVKTTLQHLIADSFKVTVRGNVYVVRAKEVTGWVPEFGEDTSNQSEFSDVNSVGNNNWVDSEDVESEVQEKQNVERNETKNHSVEKTQKGATVLSGDPFGLEVLIKKSAKKSTKAAQKSNDCTPNFPPGFTPQHSEQSGSDLHEIPPQVTKNQNCHPEVENSFNKSIGDSQKTHVDSIAGPKPVNGFSILERFQEFIDIGQAMGYGMKGCEKDYKRIITSMGDYAHSNVFAIVKCEGYRGREKKEWLKFYVILIQVIIMGDFNEVRYPSERYGSSFHSLNAAEFNRFIANSHLIDIPLGGYSFTWSDKYASKMSKLDRFLVSQGTLDLFPNLTGLILHRNISDHRLILLKEAHVDYGPTPFRLYHSWFLEDDFQAVIVDSWNNDGVVATNSMTLLKNKLKCLKQRLKDWSTVKRRSNGHTRKSLRESFNEIELRIDKGERLPDDLVKRATIIRDLNDFDQKDAIDLAQKSKIKWAIEGDENSKFFHGIVNKKRRHLAIKGILVNGESINNPIRVKSEFYNYFSDIFLAPESNCAPFEGIFPKHLDYEQSCEFQEQSTSLREDKYGWFARSNELLSWCKAKGNNVSVKSLDFQKAFVQSLGLI
ncbi:RNA-directed DNA polymerase, eukaryota [Tanacetum coccineum]